FRQLNDSRSNSLERGEFSFSGAYSGQAFADFLLGRADEATRALGTSRQDLRSREFELGISDEWRIHERLTLTLGLAYHYYGPFRSTRGNISVFRPLLFEPPPDGGLVDLGSGNSELGQSFVPTVVEPDRNDFAPRIGLAYRPFGSGRIVLRASYGIYYEPIASWLYENYMGRNYPYYYQQSSEASIDSVGLDLGSPFETATPTELTIRDISSDLSTPYGQNWDIRLQNELTDHWNLELSYRGRRSVHQVRIIPANVPLPGAGEIQRRRPNSEYGRFSIVTGGGSSLFYEFQTDLRRRFENGFTFDVAFEWRRAFNDSFDDYPSNPRDLRAEWAPSEGMRSRRLRFNYILELPFGEGRAFGKVPAVDFLLGGWRFSGIAEIMSGQVFSVLLPGDPNNDGLSNDRPDRLNTGNLEGGQQSIDRWFDTEAFGYPEPYGFGNAGRNILLGPGLHNWDMSLIKDFVLSNDHRFEIRFAFFNAFNHTNFENPDSVFGTRTFGVISGAGRAREIEIALKYSF
ncbi:MAG: hypothetical protein JSU96_18475, partial [Acidobacteriota bacterium]